MSLGEESEPEQIDEVFGVALIVLYASVSQVVPEWVGEVQVRTELVEQVGQPVPAITGFEHHFGVLAGLGDLAREGLGVVVDVHRLEQRPRAIFVDKDRTVSVEVDSDVTLFHGLSPSSCWFVFANTKRCTARVLTTRRSLVVLRYRFLRYRFRCC